jgi:antitoxin component of RelBE/YafQ-DinJ toxin-antitoxin module
MKKLPPHTKGIINVPLRIDAATKKKLQAYLNENNITLNKLLKALINKELVEENLIYGLSKTN